jgi:sorbitol-specific phosphotransferase system component IIBC
MSETIEALHAQRAELDAKIERETERAQAAEHVDRTTIHERHDGMLRVIGAAMEKRLGVMRADGGHGEDATDDEIGAALAFAAQHGDYVAVAIFAGMLHVRQLLKGE